MTTYTDTCAGCGYTLTTTGTFEQHQDKWVSIHTYNFHLARQRHPAFRSKFVVEP